ncbi:MAG: DNA-processing protein DprA [Treponema sp.]|jgi:DNA processing protein|nr:DNA-processing protein DprA [Treponema sp.]
MDEGRGLLDLVIGRIPRISAAEKIRLCSLLEREADAARLSPQDVKALLGRKTYTASWTMDGLRKDAERDHALARLRGIGYVSYGDRAYPPLLREFYDPPPVLFYQGGLPDPEQPLAAVVGTRKPTGAAAAAAYDIGRSLGAGGVPVVSGLALGIDAMAHRGAIEGGGATIAVLGSGLDAVYPAANRALARKILERGGMLCSEYPPGTPPRKWQFPARNRIIAGLARGTLIVEAPAGSGALITAQFALDQGRDLWVSAVGVHSIQGEGTAKLAQEGGRLISRGEEILAEWGLGAAAALGSPAAGESGAAELESPEGASPGAVLARSLAQALKIRLRGQV